MEPVARPVARWLPWAIAAAAGIYTLGVLLAQIETQHNLNLAMQGVKANVAAARELTAGTASALAPLAATAETITAMNSQLRATAADLRAMNEAMGRVTTRQAAIMVRLESLNSRMRDVGTALGTVDAKNKGVLETNTALTGMTHQQADSMESLSGLTGGASRYLQQLNRKFSFLKDL